MAGRHQPPFNPATVRAVAEVLGRTSGGLTGSEIDRVLVAKGLPDPIGDQQRQAPAGYYVRGSKADRITSAILEQQSRTKSGRPLVGFINQSMTIVSHVGDPDRFRRWQGELDEVLITEGLQIREDGRVSRASGRATTLDQVAQLAGRVERKLTDLECHPEALRYCDVELLRRSNFHAASESVKGIFDRIRTASNSSGDGAQLVDDVFGFRKKIPRLTLSRLETDSEKSEQTGLMNLIKGLYGLYRNPLAHTPRKKREEDRPVSEAELVALLISVSLVHHHLDRCSQVPSA